MGFPCPYILIQILRAARRRWGDDAAERAGTQGPSRRTVVVERLVEDPR